MGEKHRIKKEDLKQFFAAADMTMAGKYHELFEGYGVKKARNGNYHCINGAGHTDGRDANASMSVDNHTGKWHCFTCGSKGNFQTLWKTFIDKARAGDSYTDFLIDLCSTWDPSFLNFSSTGKKDADFERNSQEIKALYDLLQDKHFKETGKPYIIKDDVAKLVKAAPTIPMEEIDAWVEALVENKEKMEYLYRTRHLDEKTIRRLKIGWFEHKMKRHNGTRFSVWKYSFPVIDSEGRVINVKAYDPFAGDPAFKWMHPFSGMTYGPVPIQNFTKNSIYFFEGEPDCYCAVSFGIEGAVTLGSVAKRNVDDIFGREKAKLFFEGKEIVICLDSDEASIKPATDLAKSLYQHAKQIKIINLDKSETNPKGLDPEIMKEVKTKRGIKMKRAEKDFTDFMMKNGFGDAALREFFTLIDNTPVFTINPGRTKKEILKVTLQESRMTRYSSSDRSKELELVASVSDFNSDAFMYPKKVSVRCRAMGDGGKKITSCASCMLPEKAGFSNSKSLEFNLLRQYDPDPDPSSTNINVSDHNILGMVQVTDAQKSGHLKRVCQINDRCRWVEIEETELEKLLHVTLSKDINEYRGHDGSSIRTGGATGIDVEAYIEGDADIYPNRSYRIRAVQTTSWGSQHAVLYIHKAEPIETIFEAFKMNQDIHDTLKVFRPKTSIKDHLNYRYNIFAGAAGITGRRELFFINDLVFFSPLEISNKLVPEVTRGWVEALIGGDTRTCKTMVSKFLSSHYKVGEMISGSSAVTRSGLLGGISAIKGKPQICWGKIPINDGGILIFDEMSDMGRQELMDMTDSRSSGIVKLDMIKSDKVKGRVRKIMLSNSRNGKEDEQREHGYGIQFLRELCFEDKVFARFDIAFVVRRTDVEIELFEAKNDAIAAEFNEYQCQQLIKWAYSRGAEDVVYEDGFNDKINELHTMMNEKYDTSTQLVNQEFRAKLIRMSIALATMLYSTPEDDWNKILVKKEHAEYVVEFLNEIYCHPNMQMDYYSMMKKRSNTLGNMTFMENICSKIDINPLFSESEFTTISLQQIFYDYLRKVEVGAMYIPDAQSDKQVSTRLKPYEGIMKLIGVMVSRNCLSRNKRLNGYKKTSMFNSWLAERIKLGEDAPKSNILELEQNKSHDDLNKKIDRLDKDSRNTKKEGSGGMA